MHVRWNILTYELARGQTDRQTNGRTGGRTDSHIPPHGRMHVHTQTLLCLHAHTILSGTYVRTDRHTHACSEASTQEQILKLEVRSKKLEVRKKKCRACIDERTHLRTNIWTYEHAREQTVGRRESNIRPHARVQLNTRTHVLMNARMYDQTFGRSNMHEDRQPARQTDGRKDSHIRPDARAHAHTRMLACLHAHMMHSGTYTRADRYRYTC